MGIQIDLDKCTGCGNCVPYCPFGLIEIVNEKALINEGCTLCGACQEACDSQAILIEAVPETVVVSDSHRGVWVFAEQKKSKVQSVVFELLSKARQLAEKLNTHVAAVLLGQNLKDEIQNLISHGADKVYLVENERLANFQDEPYTNVLVELIKK